VADDRIADLDQGDGAADGFDPAGVFVAHDVRQGDRYAIAPEAFDDVEVGPTNACAADAHDDIAGPGDLRFRHVLIDDEVPPAQAGVIAGEDRRFHRMAAGFDRVRLREILAAELGRHQDRFQGDQILFALGILKAQKSGDQLLRIMQRNQALLEEDLVAHLEGQLARLTGSDRTIRSTASWPT
jgi:hypothetical protein